MKTFVVTYLGALFTALLLTPALVRLARRFKLFDQPNVRKVHTSPTPRLGGVAILLAMLCFALPALLLHNVIGDQFRAAAPRVVGLLAASTLVFLVGLIDDLYGLPSALKLVAILAATVIVCASGTRIASVSLGNWMWEPGWLSWPLTAAWILGITVGVNFIDGLDGLAAGISAITCGVIGAVAMVYGQMVPAILALALLGSLTGFLVHNFHPAKIFMGDCGSMFVGFTLASASAMCASKAQSFLGVLVPGLALAVPIFDTAFTVIRRGILQRRPIFAAERGHIHHRLLAMGFRQRHAVLILYGVTLTSASVGVAMLLARSTAILLVAGALLLPLAMFRLTGVARLRNTLSALRRNFRLSRSTHDCRDMFAEMEMRLRAARNFQDWWRTVCEAANVLNLARVALPLQNRDGSTQVLMWCRENCTFQPDEVLSVTVPVRQRRTGALLRCEIAVPAKDSFEMASRRTMFFARLLEENSIAKLPMQLRKNRSVESGATVDGPEGAAAAEPPFIKPKRRDKSARGVVRREVPASREVAAAAGKRRIAVVHDFLYTYAGAERVLEQILKVYPEADVFSLFDFVPPEHRGFLQGKRVTTTFLQRMPMARRKHRAYLPLMPLAIEQLDVSEYDIVISSSYLAAKGVLTRSDQLHICYCHTPVRFAWDLQGQYLTESGLISGIKSILARSILHYIRNWDVQSVNRVDRFVTNSNYVGKRIEKIYRRDAVTIYPPVDVDNFTPEMEKEDFYLTVSRLVPYKKIDMIVEAFTKLGDRRLIVIGDGPDFEKIKAKAGPNITMLGFQPHEHVKEYMQRARAFVFAAEEDFGIVPVEAQACGTPVIAYARGGVTESVVPGRTGTFFTRQTVESLLGAVKEFEANDVGWNPKAIRANAELFSADRFRAEFQQLVENQWMNFTNAGRTRVDATARETRPARQAAVGALGLLPDFVDAPPAPLQGV
jgi:UDP-N-acetylmuramyl pentapeptide phosphotransferase/UDP-N-acetylglucosamine-1-phosphate transferase/glycosyltransferase involved in cell wall biosynthesis